MTEPVLIDTGPLVAILSDRDQFHAQCVAEFQRLSRAPVTTWPVLTEAAWLLRGSQSQVQALLGLVRVGAVKLEPLSAEAAGWISEFMGRYRSLGAQLADASLMYVAERDRLGRCSRLTGGIFLCSGPAPARRSR